jgi:membrane protein DedA with SNARE-associated domain
VVALAAVSASVGEPDLLVLGGCAAVGAFVGDNIAYSIGRHTVLARLPASRNAKIRSTMRWAERELDRRGAMIIIAARYVPVGRVAANLTAGATRFTRPRFVLLTAIAAVSWAAYSVALGALAGTWMKDNPLLGATIAVAVAVAFGALIDWFLRSRGAAPAEEEAQEVDATP